jgi:diacylglycerol kinase
MSDEPLRGDGRLTSSFRYAWAGILYVLRSQRNFRIHILITLLVVLLGLWVKLIWMEWAIIALTVAMVLMAEMFNTVAETAIDMATKHYHPLAKIAKDVAAGAVLIMAVMAVVIGLLVLGPHVVERFLPLFL